MFGKSQATPYGFTGQEQDDESDLGYFSHRYLAHSSAQFVTPDPVFAQSERFENPQHWSAYSYAVNNPIRFTDPSGEIPFDTIWDGLNIVYDLGKVGVGYATNNPVMVNDGLVDLACDTAALLIPYAPAGSTKMARLSSDVADVKKKSGVPGDDFVPNPNITQKYIRPSGAGPTAAQKAAVQGKPCVDCGVITSKQVADHKDPLVVQYYREGGVNVQQQSQIGAVQPHCPACSSSQGGQLGAFGRKMKKDLGL